MPHSEHEQLRQAFTQTRYQVAHAGGTLTVLVGQPPPVALQLHSWLIITADNPHARQIDPDDNQRRRSALQTALQRLRMPMLPTRHSDPAGAWPDELGWLVFTSDKHDQLQADCCESVLALGQRYAQRALLCYDHQRTDCDSIDVVRLLWL